MTAATETELRRMALAAPLPPDLRQLYAHNADWFAPGFELFEPAIYEDVNGGRAAFGELAEMVFFADDQGSGFYFIDADDHLGLGAGFVFWVDRGLMGADAVVPVAAALADALARAEHGEDVRAAPTLGERALARLERVLQTSPPGVDVRPGVDRTAFAAARAERGVVLTMATGAIWMLADGIYFPATGREVFPLSRIHCIADGRIAIVGRDPTLGHLGVTRGDWQDLPADRLIAFADRSQPEQGRLLGRCADVLAYWIEEAAA